MAQRVSLIREFIERRVALGSDHVTLDEIRINVMGTLLPVDDQEIRLAVKDRWRLACLDGRPAVVLRGDGARSYRPAGILQRIRHFGRRYQLNGS